MPRSRTPRRNRHIPSSHGFRLALLAFVVAVAAALMPGLPARAATLGVNAAGTGPYPTIQAAVDAAVDGDEVVLESGTYSGPGNEKVAFAGKAITIRSALGDPATCIIALSPPDGWAFEFVDGEGPASVLEGITIEGYGSAGNTWHKPGLFVRSDPTIRNVVVRNVAAQDAGGILVLGGDPLITGCLIESNTSLGTYVGGSWGPGSHGGGIHLESSDATIEVCVIRGNESIDPIHSWGGGISVRWGSPTVIDCVITGNMSRDRGGGISVMNGSLSIHGTTIAGNSAETGGGVIALADGSIDVERSIVWGNCASVVSPEIHTNDISTILLSCCVADSAGANASTTWGADNIFADPRFCDPRPCDDAPTGDGDWALRADSPAAADPTCGPIGALGVECAVSVSITLEETSFGRIKAHYR